MKPIVLMTVVAIFLNGCAGVSITPISNQQAVNAHSDGTTNNGYIVYEPIVVVEVSQKEVCVQKDKNGKCLQTETRCSVGTPFTLPDYSKPYLVEVKSGFGKAGVEIEIKDGWMLGKVKDISDNTAVLGLVEKLLGLEKAAFFPGAKPSGGCEAPGLYKVSLLDGKVVLEQFHLY